MRFGLPENVDKRQANKGFAQPGRPLARALCFIMVWATFLGPNDHSDLRFAYEILWFFDGDFRVWHFAFRSNFFPAHSTSEKFKNASLESLCFKWFGGCRNGPRHHLRCIPSYELPGRRATILQSEILSVAPARSKFSLCKIVVQKPQ